MSNFVYNDNFNGGDKEPIQFNFDAPRKSRGKAIAITCVICSVAMVLVYTLLGMWLFNTQGDGELAPERVESPNVVYTNTVIQSSDTSPVKGSTAEGGISRAEMIEQIKDTVVEIRTQSVVSQNQYIKSGAGSGVIVGRYEIKDEKTGSVLTGNTYSVRSVDENGEVYECRIKPYRNSDKMLINMIMR